MFREMDVAKSRRMEHLFNDIRKISISNERKKKLAELVEYIQSKRNSDQEVHLNFICTHNSRRSQFAQFWAKVAANYYSIPMQSYSGGVEVTAFNPRAVETIRQYGFRIESSGAANPVYDVYYSDSIPPLKMFSKLFDDEVNPNHAFAAVMTCSDADENCPFIPGTERRIALNYEDPKEYDGSPQEVEMYDLRSRQIASELFYVFSKIM